MKPNLPTILATVVIATTGVVWYLNTPEDPESEGAQLPEAPQERHAASAPAPATASPRHETGKLNALLDQTLTWQQRVELANQLLVPGQLAEQEIDALFACMSQQPAGNPENWFVVVNEIMEVMREQGIGSDRYTAELASVMVNPQVHPVVRDYAVQHLSMWVVPPTESSPGEADPAQVIAVLDTFGALIVDQSLSHTSIPGTTAMALADVTTRNAEIASPVWQRITPQLSDLLNGGAQATVVTKVSVVQAAAIAGVRELEPLTAQLAGDPSTQPSVRLSSVAALGVHGNPERKQLLETIAQSDPRLRFAAAAAINKLLAR
ncbi:HEAT repeat domain-containing protein [Sulfuriroseicoccus oceanibius]|uniref:HEAT repeat domain-containing protein n=1 Tax=Sulfuriroseicoccus oceanibius TaxID=2707525 RepID=A0A6B3L8G1_9BACT|nr:HEAT repeat domain-containing protein [Sulfuriroseicoccus oceanibius]QQL43725.1 HEAT repeat domain-containing protein [Sulfuriroseicoccus oceanibius]